MIIFFEPAIAMIYVAFVLLYLAGKFFFGRIKHTDETYLVNVIDLFKEYIRGELSQVEKELAFQIQLSQDNFLSRIHLVTIMIIK